MTKKNSREYWNRLMESGYVAAIVMYFARFSYDGAKTLHFRAEAVSFICVSRGDRAVSYPAIRVFKVNPC